MRFSPGLSACANVLSGDGRRRALGLLAISAGSVAVVLALAGSQIASGSVTLVDNCYFTGTSTGSMVVNWASGGSGTIIPSGGTGETPTAAGSTGKYWSCYVRDSNGKDGAQDFGSGSTQLTSTKVPGASDDAIFSKYKIYDSSSPTTVVNSSLGTNIGFTFNFDGASLTLGQIDIDQSIYGNQTWAIGNGDALTVQDDLNWAKATFKIGSSTTQTASLTVQGNLTMGTDGAAGKPTLNQSGSFSVSGNFSVYGASAPTVSTSQGITVGGNFLAGSSCQSGSAWRPKNTFSVGGNFTVSSTNGCWDGTTNTPTLDLTGGSATVTLPSGTTSASNSVTNLTVDGTDSSSVKTIVNTLTVAKSVSLNTGQLGGSGIVNATNTAGSGAVTIGSAFNGGSATLELSTSSPPSMTSNASAIWPALDFEQTPASTFTIAGGAVHTQGNVTFGSGSSSVGGQTLFLDGSSAVTVTDNRSSGNRYTGLVDVTNSAGVTVSGTLRMQGGMTRASGSGAISGGTLRFSGSDTLTDGSSTNVSSALDIAGSGQSISGTWRQRGDVTLEPSTGTALTGGTLLLTPASGTTQNVTLSAGETVASNLTIDAADNTGIVAISSGQTLTSTGTTALTTGKLNTGTLEAQGALSAASTFNGGTGSLLIDGGSAQTFTGTQTSSAGDLPNTTISGSGTAVTLSGSLRTAHSWTLSSPATLAASTSTVYAAGATITGSQTFYNLTTVGGSTTTIGASTTATVSNALTFTSGKIDTNTNTSALVSVGASASVTQTSGYVIGPEQKTFGSTGSGKTFTFDVGGSTNERKVAINSMNVTATGTLTVQVSQGNTADTDIFGNSGSGIDTAKDLNRYWTFTPAGGFAATSADITYNFVSAASGEVDSGATTTSFVGAKYKTAATAGWTTYTSGVTASANSTELTGVSLTSADTTEYFGLGQANVGPLDHFAITASGGGSIANQTAGVPFDIKITAQDSNNLTETSFTGTVTLSSVGSTCTASCGTTAAFTNGVLTVTGVKLTTAATGVTLHVTDGATPTAHTGDSNSFNVVAGSATKLVITGSSSQTAGSSQSLTITAKDAYGNTATTYTGDKSLTFSGASTAPDGSHHPTVTDKSAAATAFGTATTVTFSNGVSSAGGSMTLYKAEGPITISTTDGSISATGSDGLSVTVTAASAASFRVTTNVGDSSVNPLPAGTSQAISITALDSYGNTATSYTGNHSLTFSGSSVAPDGTTHPTVAGTNFGTATTVNFSSGASATTPAMKLYNATESQPRSIAVTDGSISTPSPDQLSVTVTAGSASKFVLTLVSPQRDRIAFGGTNTNTLKVQDAYQNTVTGFSTANASDSISVGVNSGSVSAGGSLTGASFSSGVADLSALTYQGATGSRTFTAHDSTTSSITDGTASVTIDPGHADATQSTLTASKTTVSTTSDHATLTLHMKDADGNALTTNPDSATATMSTTGAASIGTVTDNGDGTFFANITDSTSETVTASAKLNGTTISGSPATQSITFTSDNKGPDITLSLASSSHAYLVAGSGSQGAETSTIYLGDQGGSFTLQGDLTDQTGLQDWAFPTISDSGWTDGHTTGNAGGTSAAQGAVGAGNGPTSKTITSNSYSFSSTAATSPTNHTVTALDTDTDQVRQGTNTITFERDSNAPTGGAISLASTSTSLTVSPNFTLYTDTAGTAGTNSGMVATTGNQWTRAQASPSSGTCPTAGSASYTSATSAANLSASGAVSDTVPTNGLCYEYTLTGTDNVGHTSSVQAVVLVDTTPPTQPTVAFSSLSAGNTYDPNSGSATTSPQLFFNPASSNSISATMTAASTDGESGIKSGNLGYTFTGVTAGDPGVVKTGTQSAGQVSLAFDNQSTGTSSATVLATNNVGLTSTTTTIKLTPDSTAPTAGTITCNSGTCGSGTGSTNGWYTADVTVSYSGGTDGGSGVHEVIYTTSGTDPTVNADGSLPAGVTAITASSGSFTLSTEGQTTVKWATVDNVGNVSAVTSQTINLDKTDPTAPSAFTGLTSATNAYWDGTAADPIWYRQGAAGGFTISATGQASHIAADTVSATYSTPSGTGWSNTAGAYSFTSGTSGDTSTSLGASVLSGLTNTTAGTGSNASLSVTIKADGTAPSTSITCNSAACSSSWYTSSPVTVALSASDTGGSGVAAIYYTTDGSTPTTSHYSGSFSAATGSFNLTSDGTHDVQWIAVDHVGNATSVQSQTIKLDAGGLTGGSGPDYFNGQTTSTSIPVTFTADTATSGVTWTLKRAASAASGSSCTVDTSASNWSTVSGPSTATGSQSYTDTSVSAGNCYRYELVESSGAGVSSTRLGSHTTQVVDTSPIEVFGASPSSEVYQSGNTVYVKQASDQFSVRIASGYVGNVQSADWAGTGNTHGDTTGTTDSTDRFPSQSYYTGAATSIKLTRHTTGGGTVSDTLTVTIDSSGPSGTITYPNSTISSGSVTVTATHSDGGGSGTSSYEFQRAVLPYDFGTSSCPSVSSGDFSDVTLTGASLTGGTDGLTGVALGKCIWYRVAYTDRVGNTGSWITSSNVVKYLDQTAPGYTSGTTDSTGGTVTISMDEALKTGLTLCASDFSLSGGHTASGVSYSGSTITLTGVSPAIAHGETVTVSYDHSCTGDPVEDSSDNVSSFSNKPVTNAVPAPAATTPAAPAPTGATVDGCSLTIDFDQTLAGAAPSSGFRVTVGGNIVSVTGIGISGSSATLTISPCANHGDSVSVHYDPPGSNPLQNSASADTTSFDLTVTNDTAAPTTCTPPQFSVSDPPDGSPYLTSVAAITLSANENVNWTNMTVTRPDNTVTALPDHVDAATTSWPFVVSLPANPGLYVVSGTMSSSAGCSASVLVHFTLWPPPGTGGNTPPPSSGGSATVPAVQKNAFPGEASSMTSSDGTWTASWDGATFGDAVVVNVQPLPQQSFTISGNPLPPNSIVVNASAFLISDHQNIHQLAGVLQLQFPQANGRIPLFSHDGATWTPIAACTGSTALGPGQDTCYYVDGADTIHVLTTHLTYFMLPGVAQVGIGLRIMNPRRIWLDGRTWVGIRLQLAQRAKITTWFVDADNGRKVPNSTQHTRTLKTGATIHRVYFPQGLRPGPYKIQVRATGTTGQKELKTAHLRILQSKPLSPLRPAMNPVGLLIVRGAEASLLGLLPRQLGGGYSVATTGTSAQTIFQSADARTNRKLGGVVIDLDKLPIDVVVGLHDVFPELQIVALTSHPGDAARDRRAGVAVVIAKPATVWALSTAFQTLLPLDVPRQP